MEFTQELAEQVWRDEHDDFETIKEFDWISQGKYDYGSMIVKHIPTGKFYRINASRSGSYYDDYDYYFSPAVKEVELKEVIIKKKKWVDKE